MKLPDRFIWASAVVNVNPTDHILEIGCGAGILAELLAGNLTTGSITAIDQSAPMIKLATRRNIQHLAAGRATFVVGNFLHSAFLPASFDKVLAFNVNFFWKNPARELQLLRKYLKPEGKLYIFYQTPPNSAVPVAELMKSQLRSHSFNIETQLSNQASAACCIIATPG